MKYLPKAQILDGPRIDIPRRILVDRFEMLLAGFGSCFAQNIQEIVRRYGFRYWYERECCAHYSAESIADRLEAVASGNPPTASDLYMLDNPVRAHAYTYFFKRHFYGDDARERMLRRMAELNERCRTMVSRADMVVVTLGTSRVMRLNSNNRLVVLMHGIPMAQARSEMLTVEQTVRHLHRITDAIARIRGGALPTVLFTLSPQRYLFTPGVAELENVSPYVDNTLSKSIARAGLHQFLLERADERLIYFPSYELVIDELRCLETLNHYNHTHVDQTHTPDYVGKRLFMAHASDQVQEFLQLCDRTIAVFHEVEDLVEGGLPPDHDQVREKVHEVVARASALDVPAKWPRTITMALGRIMSRAGWHEWITEIMGMDSYHPFARYDAAQSLYELGRDAEAAALCRSVQDELAALPLEYPDLAAKTDDLLVKIKDRV